MTFVRWFAGLLATASAGTSALAQEVPPGPPISVTMVTQLSPTIPQYLRVDIPRLREGIPQRSGGRIQVTLASWPERNLNGPELLRVLRAGQIDLGGIALPTVAGDVPLLDIIDLAGLLQSHEQGRRVAEAMMPEHQPRARARRRAHHRHLSVPGAGVLLPRADREPRRPQGQARAHARRLAERLHPGDRRRSRWRSAFPKSTARSSAASSTAPSPAPRPATARAGTR